MIMRDFNNDVNFNVTSILDYLHVTFKYLYKLYNKTEPGNIIIANHYVLIIFSLQTMNLTPLQEFQITSFRIIPQSSVNFVDLNPKFDILREKSLFVTLLM